MGAAGAAGTCDDALLLACAAATGVPPWPLKTDCGSLVSASVTAASVTSGVAAAFAVSSSAVRTEFCIAPGIGCGCVIFCIGVTTDSLAGISVPVVMAWAAAARAVTFGSASGAWALR